MRELIQTVVEKWNELSKPQNSTKLTQLLPATTLTQLDTDEMETLFSLLPQFGAIKDRQRGALKIVSLGYHAHIQGTDLKCPYPIDFFVRVSGVLSSLNLVIRLPADRVTPNMFYKENLGRDFDLLAAFSTLIFTHKVRLTDLELVLQLMYRPGAPHSFQWGTPGGMQSTTEDAKTRSLEELSEEAAGLMVIASRLLLENRLYQSGNIAEYHSVTGVLCIGEPKISEQARQEGIIEYKFLPLSQALWWLSDQCKRNANDEFYNLPDAKIEHALLKLFSLCASRELM